MRKLLMGTGILFIVFLSLSARTEPKHTHGKLDFTFVNHTGYTLYALYTTESTDTHWGEDLLPEDVCENNDEIEISFEDDDDGDCKWDFKATRNSAGTSSYTLKKIDLCKVSKLTFYLDGDGICRSKSE